MSAIRLIRRMEQAGLITYMPEDGKPIVLFEGGRFYRFWTDCVRWEDEHSIWWKSDPDDNCIMGTNKKALDLMQRILA